MNHLIANRMDRIGTETAFEMLAKAKILEQSGRDVIHLEIGEPDFATPNHIVKAGVKALDNGMTKYTPSSGLPEVKAEIAKYISTSRGIEVDEQNVVVVPGAKPIILFSILATVNPGDEVIYPNPGFPIYESSIKFAKGIPIPIPLREENNFRVDTNELQNLITSKTKMIILNSPANPTGATFTKEDIENIASLVIDKNIIILSDEIYEKIIYDSDFYSIASEEGMKNKTIILNGFSKTYSMTGWRLGYGVMEKTLAEAVTKLIINSNSCVPAFIQMAGAAALNGNQGFVKAMVGEFQKRRDYIIDRLNSIHGISCIKPQGAFYVFPNVKKLNLTSSQLSDFFLNEAGVAVLGGSAFGSYGEGFLRLSYASSLEQISKALDRIEAAIKTL